LSIPAVEYVQDVAALGTLTGEVKQFLFFRDFSGIWNLKTGDVDFNDAGFYSATGGYRNNNVFSLSPDSLPMLVSYNNDPLVNSVDLARLTVTGNNLGTGVSMILSGRF
jgi:hypothetical protein